MQLHSQFTKLLKSMTSTLEQLTNLFEKKHHYVNNACLHSFKTCTIGNHLPLDPNPADK